MQKKYIYLALMLLLTWAMMSCQPAAPAANQEKPAEKPAAEKAEAEKPTEAAKSEPAADKPLEKVAIQLSWVKQGEYHGIFNAIENGFYKEVGLDVEVLPGGPDVRPVQVVASGTAQFGIGGPSTVIASRANGVPVVLILQSQQDSPQRFIAKKSRGITKIEDVKGKNFGVWFGGGEYEPMLMVKKAGLNPDDVNWTAQKFSMIEFYEDKLDVAVVMIYNEWHVVLDAGYSPDELTVFSAADYGAAVIGDGVYTTEDMIKNKPEVVQAFVDATIRGWKWGLEHPEECANIVLKFNPELELRKQLLQCEEMNKLNISRAAAEHGLGYMDIADWEVSQAALVDVKAIEKPLDDLKAGFNLSFWEKTPEDYKSLKGLDLKAIQDRITKNLQ